MTTSNFTVFDRLLTSIDHNLADRSQKSDQSIIPTLLLSQGCHCSRLSLYVSSVKRGEILTILTGFRGSPELVAVAEAGEAEGGGLGAAHVEEGGRQAGRRHCLWSSGASASI